jgi:hypothetical protein
MYFLLAKAARYVKLYAHNKPSGAQTAVFGLLHATKIPVETHCDPKNERS